jgi:phosphopantetheine--protein transferase-like protein
MRLSFQLGLRVGTDIIATNRVLSPHQPDLQRAIKLTNRFLLAPELRDLTRRFPSWNDVNIHQDQLRTQQVAAWIAGRWAAKEAAKKAWNASLLGFRDLRVEADSSGAVQIICDTSQTTSSTSGDYASSETITEQVAQLSISHDRDYTIATVLATPLHPDISCELERRKQLAEAKVRHLPA